MLILPFIIVIVVIIIIISIIIIIIIIIIAFSIYQVLESTTRELQHFGWLYVRELYFCILKVFVVYCFPKFSTFGF